MATARKVGGYQIISIDKMLRQGVGIVCEGIYDIIEGTEKIIRISNITAQIERRSGLVEIEHIPSNCTRYIIDTTICLLADGYVLTVDDSDVVTYYPIINGMWLVKDVNTDVGDDTSNRARGFLTAVELGLVNGVIFDDDNYIRLSDPSDSRINYKRFTSMIGKRTNKQVFSAIKDEPVQGIAFELLSSYISLSIWGEGYTHFTIE